MAMPMRNTTQQMPGAWDDRSAPRAGGLPLSALGGGKAPQYQVQQGGDGSGGMASGMGGGGSAPPGYYDTPGARDYAAHQSSGGWGANGWGAASGTGGGMPANGGYGDQRAAGWGPGGMNTGGSLNLGGGSYAAPGPDSGGGGPQLPPQPGDGGQGMQDWSQGLGVSGGSQPWQPGSDPGMGVHNPSGEYRAQWGAGDITTDPGYQYEQQQAAQGTNAALAARGLSNSGGALKELQDRAQGIAQGHAGDAFNRYMGQLGFNAGQGQQGYQNAQNALGNAYNRFSGDRSYYQGERQRLFGNATGEDQRQWQNAFQGGQQGWQNQFNQNNQNFDNYYRLASLGLNATGQNAGYLSGYGNDLAGLYGDQSNVNAAGTIGQANDWAQGFTGAGGAAQDYYGQRRR